MGSTFFALKNVAKFFPPWTVTRTVWLNALRPDVSGITVNTLLFHEAGRRLIHRYRIYKDPFPHPALRDGVIPDAVASVHTGSRVAATDLAGGGGGNQRRAGTGVAGRRWGNGCGRIVF